MKITAFLLLALALVLLSSLGLPNGGCVSALGSAPVTIEPPNFDSTTVKLMLQSNTHTWVGTQESLMVYSADLTGFRTLYDQTSNLALKINSAGVLLDNSTILFHAILGSDVNSVQLWAANTTNVWFVSHAATVYHYEEALYRYNGEVYFTSRDIANGPDSALITLSATNGFSTRNLHTWTVITSANEIDALANIGDFCEHPGNGWLYFVVAEVEYGMEVWRTDGSSVVLALDFFPGPKSSVPAQLRPFNGTHLIFGALRLAPSSWTVVALSASDEPTNMTSGTTPQVDSSYVKKGSFTMYPGTLPGTLAIMVTRSGAALSPYASSGASGDFNLYAYLFSNLTDATLVAAVTDSSYIAYNRLWVGECAFALTRSFDLVVNCFNSSTWTSLTVPSQFTIHLIATKPLGAAFQSYFGAESGLSWPGGDLRFVAATNTGKYEFIHCNTADCFVVKTFPRFYSGYNLFFAASPEALTEGVVHFVGPDGFLYISFANATLYETGIRIYTPAPPHTSVQLVNMVTVDGKRRMFGVAAEEGFYQSWRPVEIINETCIVNILNSSYAGYDIQQPFRFFCSSVGCMIFPGNYDTNDYLVMFYPWDTAEAYPIPGLQQASSRNTFVAVSAELPGTFVFTATKNNIDDAFIWNHNTQNLTTLNIRDFLPSTFDLSAGLSPSVHVSSNGIVFLYPVAGYLLRISLHDAHIANYSVNPNTNSRFITFLDHVWFWEGNDLMMVPNDVYSPIQLVATTPFFGASTPLGFGDSFWSRGARLYLTRGANVTLISDEVGAITSSPTSVSMFEPPALFQLLCAVVPQAGNQSVDDILEIVYRAPAYIPTVVRRPFYQGKPVGDESTLVGSAGFCTQDILTEWALLPSTAKNSTGLYAYTGTGTADFVISFNNISRQVGISGFEGLRYRVAASAPPGQSGFFWVNIVVNGHSAADVRARLVSTELRSVSAPAGCSEGEVSIDGKCILDQCVRPTPTTNAYCNSTTWVVPSDVTIGPSGNLSQLIVPGKTIIQGRLIVLPGFSRENVSLVIHAGATLVVEGCATLGGILEVELTPEELSTASGSKQVVTFNDFCSLSTFSNVKLTGEVSTCKRLDGSTNSQPSLTVTFSVVETCALAPGVIAGIVTLSLAVVGGIIALSVYCALKHRKKATKSQEMS